MKDIAITIKPTLACNMHCRHCFNGSGMDDNTMLDIDTVERVLDLAASEYESVKITFHGGEPTLAGFKFYQDFFAYQNKLSAEKGTTFANYFTTNGLLLDEAFINLLKRHNTMINISFDGLFNDILRFNSSEVLNNILLAQKLNAKMRIFCTLTSKSVPHLIELYNWFNELNISFKIAPLEPWGYALDLPELLINADDYIKHLMEAYQYWLHDLDCRIKFYTFEEFIQIKPNQQFKPFWFHREMALNPDGRLYPFGRPNDIKYCLGDPFDIVSLSGAFESDAYKDLLSKLELNRKHHCLSCPSLNVCNGVIENMTYMYVDDEDLVQARCQVANETFRNVMRINGEVIADCNNGHENKYNPRAIQLLTACL